MTVAGDKSDIKARIVRLEAIHEIGERLLAGGLVAFPTETVYGLGCNAMDESAVRKVFQAKERPLTDPLITHVTENDAAFDLWHAPANSLEGKALQALMDEFWPGPLTLVAKAKSSVPSIIMANTGFVACRFPQHPIAIALINAASVPIAAPSANKFGHVSPTRASHVWDDLLHEDVWILEADAEISDVCSVGVESSVAKLEMLGDEEGRITLLRQGAVCVEDMQVCLEKVGLGGNFSIVAKTKKATDESVAHVAPGQTIRHYSPDIPSFILAQSRILYEKLSNDDETSLGESVLIDFGGKLLQWETKALAYRDLSPAGRSGEATKHLFETLRWAERVEGATRILFPEIRSENGPDDALTLALKDRLTRAASGVTIDSFSRG